MRPYVYDDLDALPRGRPGPIRRDLEHMHAIVQDSLTARVDELQHLVRDFKWQLDFAADGHMHTRKVDEGPCWHRMRQVCADGGAGGMVEHEYFVAVTIARVAYGALHAARRRI